MDLTKLNIFGLLILQSVLGGLPRLRNFTDAMGAIAAGRTNHGLGQLLMLLPEGFQSQAIVVADLQSTLTAKIDGLEHSQMASVAGLVASLSATNWASAQAALSQLVTASSVLITPNGVTVAPPAPAPAVKAAS